MAICDYINRQNRRMRAAYRGQCALSTTLPGDSLHELVNYAFDILLINEVARE
jgi:hypothetical protein